MFAKVQLLALVTTALSVTFVQATPLNNRSPRLVRPTGSVPPVASPSRTCATTNTVTLTVGWGASGSAVPSGTVSSAFSAPTDDGPGCTVFLPSGPISSGFPEPTDDGSASCTTIFGPISSGFPEPSDDGPYPIFPSGPVSSGFPEPTDDGPGCTVFPSGPMSSGFPTGAVPTDQPSDHTIFLPDPVSSGFPTGAVPTDQPSDHTIFLPGPVSSGFSRPPTPTAAVTNTYPSGVWSPDCSVVVTVTQRLPFPRPTGFFSTPF